MEKNGKKWTEWLPSISTGWRKLRDCAQKHKYRCAFLLFVVGVIITCFVGCEITQDHAKQVASLVDSVTYYQMKNGEILAVQTQYEAERSLFHKAIQEDKAYIKELEKRVGSIRTITKTKLQVQVDTLVMSTTDTIIQGDTVRVFSYNDQWLSLNGSVGRDVVLNSISLPARLILTEGKRGVGVSVDNPYIKISDIRSVTRPEKRWSIGVTTGVGVVWDGGLQAGPGVMVGFNYRLW